MHSTYILGGKALPIYAVTIIFSLMFSIAIIYRAYGFVYGFAVLITVVVELLIVSIASTLIDEINEGTAQVYLSGGLSRTEYVWSWLVSSIFYPALALALSIILPAFIISPDTIFMDISMGYGHFYPAIGVYGSALGIQVFLHVLLSIIIGLHTRRKAYSILVVVFLAIIYPILVGFMTALLGIGMHEYLWTFTVAAFIPIVPLYALPIIPPNALNRSTIYLYDLTIPLTISVVALLIFVFKVRNSLEV